MIFIIFLLYALSGMLIACGLHSKVRGILNKALQTGKNEIFFSLVFRVSGFLLLAFLLLTYKTHHLAINLTFFMVSMMVTLGYFFTRGM